MSDRGGTGAWLSRGSSKRTSTGPHAEISSVGAWAVMVGTASAVLANEPWLLVDCAVGATIDPTINTMTARRRKMPPPLTSGRKYGRKAGMAAAPIAAAPSAARTAPHAATV